MKEYRKWEIKNNCLPLFKILRQVSPLSWNIKTTSKTAES